MAGLVERPSRPDLARAERAIAEFLRALGFDPDSAELRETPERVAAAYATELLRGYDEDLASLLEGGAETSRETLDPVLIRGVRITAVCPHHLLVAEGIADIAYHPGERLFGLGTLSRLVTMAAARLVFQEQIAGDVTRALMASGAARGAYCRVELQHACLRSRGAEETEAQVASFSSAGTLADPGFLAGLFGSEGRTSR